MKDLELHLTNPTKGLLDNCEMYAKMALLMFYSFQQVTDLTCHGSYWKKIIKNSQVITIKKTNNSGKRISNTSKYTGKG
jgi:hypothetical protein